MKRYTVKIYEVINITKKDVIYWSGITIIVLAVCILPLLLVGVISPFVDLQLAGSEDNITHIFIEDATNKTDDYKLLTKDKEEIHQLFRDIKSTWNTNLWFTPKDEHHYFIIFDDDNDPLKTGHNGFIVYYPQSDTFTYLTKNHGYSVSLETSNILKQFVDKTLRK